MLLTEDLEKIPDNQHCSAGGAGQPACSPGFFDKVGAGTERRAELPAACTQWLPLLCAAHCSGFWLPLWAAPCQLSRSLQALARAHYNRQPPLPPLRLCVV